MGPKFKRKEAAEAGLRLGRGNSSSLHSLSRGGGGSLFTQEADSLGGSTRQSRTSLKEQQPRYPG